MDKILLSFLAICFFVSCSNNNKPSLQKPITNEVYESQLNEGEILILDQLDQPLIGAEILIGNEVRGDNLFLTNVEGKILIPSSWQDKKAISIQAKGYVSTTYLNLMPTKQVLRVRKLQKPRAFTVKGLAKGYGNLKRDDWVNFGMILPKLSKANFMKFSLNTFISPINDTIEVMNRELDVPSNISLPDQKERYLFFTIRLDKPQYRYFLDETGSYSMVAVHARFPFKKVIDEVRSGKPLAELMNYFDFLEMGMEDVDVLSPVTEMDLNVNQEVLSPGFEIMAPSLPSGYSYFSAALNLDGTLYFASDIKSAKEGENISLKTKSNGVFPYALGAIARQMEDKDGNTSLDPAMSVTMLPALAQNQMKHLNLIAKPDINGKFVILDRPQVNGTHPLVTHLSLSDVGEKNFDGQKLEESRPVWDVYAKGWVEQIELPELPNEIGVRNTERWQVNFASSLEAEDASGPEAFEMAEFITRNAKDY